MSQSCLNACKYTYNTAQELCLSKCVGNLNQSLTEADPSNQPNTISRFSNPYYIGVVDKKVVLGGQEGAQLLINGAMKFIRTGSKNIEDYIEDMIVDKKNCLVGILTHKHLYYGNINHSLVKKELPPGSVKEIRFLNNNVVLKIKENENYIYFITDNKGFEKVDNYSDLYYNIKNNDQTNNYQIKTDKVEIEIDNENKLVIIGTNINIETNTKLVLEEINSQTTIRLKDGSLLKINGENLIVKGNTNK